MPLIYEAALPPNSPWLRQPAWAGSRAKKKLCEPIKGSSKTQPRINETQIAGVSVARRHPIKLHGISTWSAPDNRFWLTTAFWLTLIGGFDLAVVMDSTARNFRMRNVDRELQLVNSWTEFRVLITSQTRLNWNAKHNWAVNNFRRSKII